MKNLPRLVAVLLILTTEPVEKVIEVE